MGFRSSIAAASQPVFHPINLPARAMTIRARATPDKKLGSLVANSEKPRRRWNGTMA